MRNSSAIEQQEPQSGFTLLETMCALAIIGLIATLALPQPGRGTTATILHGLAYRVAAVLDADRFAARRHGHAGFTTLDPRSRHIVSGASGMVLTLPADLTLTSDRTHECGFGRERQGVAFTPDGYACGDFIRMETAQSSVEIRINALTGGALIVE